MFVKDFAQLAKFGFDAAGNYASPAKPIAPRPEIKRLSLEGTVRPFRHQFAMDKPRRDVIEF